jgi:DNA-binding protein HU-beta
MTTKTDLIDSVSKKLGTTKKQTGDVVNALFDSIIESLASGNNISLPGFGTFNAKRREARTGRNPATGAEIKIPAKNVASFKAGKGLTDALNAKK